MGAVSFAETDVLAACLAVLKVIMVVSS